WAGLISRMPGLGRAAHGRRDDRTRGHRGARATVTEASWLMTGHGVARLPVVDDEERLVGIVTRGDLLRPVLRTDAEIERAVRRDVLGATLWLTPRRWPWPSRTAW
ncbi:CBS domain-containing protein, partial [Streptomyces thermocarboxydus]